MSIICRNWAMDNKQEVGLFIYAKMSKLTISLQLIDIIETVYRGASKGRGLVVSPKGALFLASQSCRN